MLTGLLILSGAVQAEDAAAPAAVRAQVVQVVERLRRDPDFQATQTVPRPHWKTKEPDAQPADNRATIRFAQWLAAAARWIAEAGRWGVWLLGALAVALLLVGVRTWMRERAAPLTAAAGPLPARVGALDVRPESLPPDVGSAARALWLRGECRAALSLLYRGALSRLIHGFAVPIRAAHTEPECRRLAHDTLGTDAAAYFSRLVGLWESAGYGARRPDPAAFLAACDQFDRFLGRPAGARTQR